MPNIKLPGAFSEMLRSIPTPSFSTAVTNATVGTLIHMATADRCRWRRPLQELHQLAHFDR